MVEIVISYGHQNITSRHDTTLEVTKDREITEKADCIVGVCADKALADLSPEFKKSARKEGAVIRVVLQVGSFEEVITGTGHPELSFSHKTDIVVRKSSFMCPRTLMIKADKSARDLDREMVKLLKDKNQKITMKIECPVSKKRMHDSATAELVRKLHALAIARKTGIHTEGSANCLRSC